MSNEPKKNEVTLTREEFRERALRAIDEGTFLKQAIESDPHTGFVVLMIQIPLLHDIEIGLFGKE